MKLHLCPLHQANREPSGLNAITRHLEELSLEHQNTFNRIGECVFAFQAVKIHFMTSTNLPNCSWYLKDGGPLIMDIPSDPRTVIK